MRENPFQFLQPPPLFLRGEEKFWDDEHISEQMLKAHLDPLHEGATRRLDFVERSARWIARLLPVGRYGRLLDVGCGPGLYAQRFHAAGYTVTGIDLSPRSIAHARHAAARQAMKITYLCGDYLHFPLCGEFDAAVIIYCDYGALSATDRAVLLHRLYTVLRPGGRLLLDVFSAAMYRDYVQSETWEHCPGGGFWSAAEYLALTRRRKYPGDVTLEQIVVVGEQPPRTYYLWNTCFTPDKLAAEGASAGFRCAAIYGDIAGADYREDTDTLAILLEK